MNLVLDDVQEMLRGMSIARMQLPAPHVRLSHFHFALHLLSERACR